MLGYSPASLLLGPNPSRGLKYAFQTDLIGSLIEDETAVVRRGRLLRCRRLCSPRIPKIFRTWDNRAILNQATGMDFKAN